VNRSLSHSHYEGKRAIVALGFQFDPGAGPS
jgi:hypothetical protein